LKSKAGEGEAGATSGTGDTRLGEAREVRQVFDDLLKQNAATPFVICGDFNDTFESEPIKTIVGSGPNALTMLFNDVPAESRISFNQPPHLSMIDYIFASPAMAARYVPASYRVVTGGSPETTGSDHNPVVAKFKVK
jgi:endonuclease/exonuclease/phosphatase family metal-dependent hydrolase